ncbi:MAG: glycosyltransferase family 2 protein [Selenomonadaceae bacterium]|nr:glycosyltransferase family 2 protein [Selenomonadaceae bacterium]
MSEPKISVIIPMYNAEKFIRQTLISVLASKFKDYEVLVVDDCSTDSSVAEAEKLLPHFDGRLKILSTEKNSGGPGIPRNVGIKNSAGKYVTFVDNDDFLLPTALGEFFELAENFQADVIHTEKCLIFNDRGKVDFTWDEVGVQSDEPHDEFVDVPFMESKKLDERFRRYLRGKFFWLPWGKCFRRDFLLENKIEFPQVRFSEDMDFCFKCLCLAKKYLRVPNIANVHRVIQSSASMKGYSLKISLEVITKILVDIDEFMSGIKFFKREPNYRQAVLKFFEDKHFSFEENRFRNVPPYEVEKIFRDELQNAALNQHGKNILTAYLYDKRILTR